MLTAFPGAGLSKTLSPWGTPVRLETGRR